jgi:deoxyribodipyrimidine photolyase-related protein
MNFGDWEDVMDQSNPFVFHSLLSSSLNIGIITPDVVLEETLAHYYGHMDIIGINDIEGFVRQLIGWREYYRMVYKYQYNELVTNNTLNHTNILSSAWYNGTTGIAPLDHSINIAFKYGYLHHILRLMLVGQFMLLSEINPHEMYRWFMEFAIDSYDWVMVPNVYGMVGYNDGGGTTTKPYISSSNYILKMSNYKKDGYWENVWRALYYNFIKNNEKMLQTNPRTRRMVWQANRLSPPELNSMLETAKEFIASIAHTK